MTDRGKEVLASFSAKQRKILTMLAGGFGNKDIAAHLCTSEQTVKNEVGRMLKGSGTDNRLHLVLWCMSVGIVKCPCSMRAERDLAKAS